MDTRAIYPSRASYRGRLHALYPIPNWLFLLTNLFIDTL